MEILADVSLAELRTACLRETRRRRRGEASDGRYCLEIIRRALAASAKNERGVSPWLDPDAQTLFIEIYTEFIVAQLNRRALFNISREDLIQNVWRRFWQAVAGKDVFPFLTLEAALAYLQQVVASAIVEYRNDERVRQRQLSLENMTQEQDEGDLATFQDDPALVYVKERFRERVRELLEGQQYELFVLRYHGQLKPQAIAALLRSRGDVIAGKAPTPRLISDVLERCFERLEKDEEIRDLLQSD